jgi:hypothetical protein
MPEREDLSKDTKADILMRKYSILREETIFAMNQYTLQTKYLQIILAGILVIIGFETQGKVDFFHNRLFITILMFAMTTVVSYIVLAVLDGLYKMIVTGARLSTIETKINELAKEKLLLWETTLAGAYHGAGYKPMPGVWHPGYCINVYLTPLVAAGIFFMPVYGAYLFWNEPLDYRILFRTMVTAGFIYSVLSAALLAKVWFGAIHARNSAMLLAQEKIAHADKRENDD